MSKFYIKELFIIAFLVPTVLLLSGPALAGFLEDVDLHGFWDSRGGLRTGNDPNQRKTSLLESRLQMELNQQEDLVLWQLRGDLVYDNVATDHDVDLEQGDGFFDLREANLLFSPTDLSDIKIGRQILTWGTGDLVFINDLFPKDWQSFFSGRDEEYLKAPSDALMISLFPKLANIDLVYIPRFDSDRYLSGERLSYYNPQLGRLAGRNAAIDADQPDQWFQDDEIHLRISRNLGGYELGFYGYRGYWKSPVGFNPLNARAFSPRLNVYGASLRGNLGPGIGNLEAGYYDSRQDRSGDNPLLANSEFRLLLGYEQEIIRELTGNLQYYLEKTLDYDAYRRNLPATQPARDEYRHLLTLRLTRQMLNQNLTLSLFTYWSPSDQDGYLRPQARYKLNDNWLLSAGGNFFFGTEVHTFFGQLEDNSNIYTGLRYSF